MACYKVYLAGPEVFLPDAIAIGQEKKRLCAEYGFEGLYPLDDEVKCNESGVRVCEIIYRANLALIAEADFGVINLTPFRGPHAYVETGFELGMLAGLRKPVLGYTNDAGDLLDRVKRDGRVICDPIEGVWRDSNGMTVEDFGNAESLMIEWALAEQGHPVVRHATAERERFRDLTGFERCLQLARERSIALF
jgi:nucleoside 2-deoxyribosyltransferase